MWWSCAQKSNREILKKDVRECGSMTDSDGCLLFGLPGMHFFHFPFSWAFLITGIIIWPSPDKPRSLSSPGHRDWWEWRDMFSKENQSESILGFVIQMPLVKDSFSSGVAKYEVTAPGIWWLFPHHLCHLDRVCLQNKDNQKWKFDGKGMVAVIPGSSFPLLGYWNSSAGCLRTFPLCKPINPPWLKRFKVGIDTEHILTCTQLQKG